MDNGVTTQEIKSDYGLDDQNELKMLDVIVKSIGLSLIHI